MERPVGESGEGKYLHFVGESGERKYLNSVGESVDAGEEQECGQVGLRQ